MSDDFTVEDDPFELNKTLELVQGQMAAQDLLYSPSAGPYPELLVLVNKPIVIRIDANLKHAKAHLHLDNGKTKNTASYAIDDGKRLVGTNKYDNPMKSWIVEHKSKLMKAWHLLRKGKHTDGVVAKLKATSFPKSNLLSVVRL